jgi:hypothetical protein
MTDRAAALVLLARVGLKAPSPNATATASISRSRTTRPPPAERQLAEDNAPVAEVALAGMTGSATGKEPPDVPADRLRRVGFSTRFAEREAVAAAASP